MRKLMQSSIAIMAVLALSLSFVQCSNAKKKIIDAQVLVINQACPMELAEGVTLVGAKSLDGDILEYTYSLAMSEADLGADFKETVEANLKQALKESPDLKKLLDEGIKVKYVYNDKDNKEIYSATFDQEDVK